MQPPGLLLRKEITPVTSPLPPWYVPDPPGQDMRPDPDVITTIPGLVNAMRRYRIWAGAPAFRVMAARCRQRVSSSAFCAALGSQHKLPRRELVRDFIGACGAEPEYRERFDRAWQRLASAAGNPAGCKRPERKEET